MKESLTYVRTEERLEGKSVWYLHSDPFISYPVGAYVTLFHFYSKSFDFSIYYQYDIHVGKNNVVPYVPDPVTLYQVLEKLERNFSLDALNYFNCCDIRVHGVVFKRDLAIPSKVYYNWPKTWLSDIHVFHKVYDNFVRNFNESNFVIT